MTDDKAQRGAQDRSRINMQERYEVEYWTEKFGVSKERLAAAVAKVGPAVKAVEAELNKK